jgi:hypothetical protein
MMVKAIHKFPINKELVWHAYVQTIHLHFNLYDRVEVKQTTSDLVTVKYTVEQSNVAPSPPLDFSTADLTKYSNLIGSIIS